MAEGNQTDTTTQGSTGTGESSAPAWTAQLPQEMRSHEKLTGYKTIGELGKAYLDLEGKSANAVQLPGENATEDEVNSFYAKLGRPGRPQDYKFDEVKLPDRFAGMKDQVEQDSKAFRSIVHKLGLNTKQANELNKFYSERVNDWDKAIAGFEAQTLEAGKEVLSKMWGDKVTENVELAKRSVLTIAEKAGVAKEIGEYIKMPGIGNDPVWIRLFAEIGKAMSEDTTGGTKMGKNEPGDVKRDAIGRAVLDFPSMKKK
jgi:hypothetical protein